MPTTVQTHPVPLAALEEPVAPPLEALCARAFALAVQGTPTAVAAAELITVAGGDMHRLGAARELVAALATLHPNSPQADRALALVTHAWLQSIAAVA